MPQLFGGGDWSVLLGVRPGYLTVEYLAGRRQRHLSSIKLYFVCAAVFFLAAPFAGFLTMAFVADGVAIRLTLALV